MHRLASSQSQHRGSRLKTSWGSGRLLRTAPVYSPACTGLLLQRLLLWCCTPLRRRLLMRVRTLGGIQACLDPAPVSDQCGGSHCQHVCQCVHSGGSETRSRAENVVTRVRLPCTHSRGSETSSRVETAITGLCVPAHT